MKILVRAPNWLGDAVMAIPALEAIRRARPDAEITALARHSVADLYRDQPFVDRVLEFEHAGRHGGFFGREALARSLRREQFHTAVLLQNAFDAAWIAWRSGIRERIGYAREGRSLLLTRAIRVPAAGEIPAHESHYYLELLRRAGWIDSREPGNAVRLRVTDAARAAAEEKLRTAGSRTGAWRCAMAPGAAYGAAKCWLPERFAEVADRLISEYGADVILFGTPGEQEIATRICAAMKNRAISLVGKTPTRELATLFAACSVFVGNDSGAMHVAAAAGLPVVGIFGSTDPKGTAPLTRQFTLIQVPASCSPCFLRTCPIDHRCMTRIESDAVFAAIARLRVSPRSAEIWSNSHV